MISEGGVGQAVAEGIQGQPVHLHVALAAARTAAVMAGHLAHAAGEGDGQTAAGLRIAEEHVGNACAALFAGEPGLQDGGQMLVLPIGAYRTAALEQQHHRGAGGVYGLDQLQLAAGQVQRGAVEVFAAGLFVVAHAEDGHVGLTGGVHCRVEVLTTGAVAEDNTGAASVVGELDAHLVAAARLKAEVQSLIGALVRTPAVDEKFIVDVQTHAVLRAQADAAVHGLGHADVAGPGHAEAAGIQLGMGQREDPVEVHGAVGTGLHRGAFGLGTVVVTAGETGVALLVAEHAGVKGMQRLAQNVAAAGVDDPGAGGHRIADAVQHGHLAGAAAGLGIVAQGGFVRAGADDRDAAQVLAQGQQAVVLQQNHAFPGNAPGQLQMIGAAQHLLRTGLVGEGVLEQPQQELHPQHAAAGGVQDGGVQLSALHQMLQGILPYVMREVVELQIHARFHAQAHGLLRRGGDEVPVVQAGDGGQVGAHKAPHAVLAAQYVGEQLVVHGDRDAVDGIIAAHGVHGAAVYKGGFKHGQAVAEHVVTAHGAGGAVQTAHRVAVAHVMLGLSGNGVRSGQVVALHAPHHLTGELAAQVGVLTVGFLAAAVTRVADQVHHRAVALVDAHGPGLGGDGVAHLPPQLRVEGGGQADLLGEAGGTVVEQAVQRLLAEQEGDAQTGLFQSVALHLVGQGGGHAAQLHAAHAVALQQCVKPVHIHGGHLAVFILGGEVAGEILVGLHNFFPQRHPAEQVVDALFHGKLGVLIGKHRKHSSQGDQDLLLGNLRPFTARLAKPSAAASKNRQGMLELPRTFCSRGCNVVPTLADRQAAMLAVAEVTPM